MVAGSSVSAANEESSLTAVSLNSLAENGNVFGTAEVSIRTDLVDSGNSLSNFDQHFRKFFIVGKVNGSAHLRNFIRDVKALGDTFNNVSDVFGHVIIDGAGFTANF